MTDRRVMLVTGAASGIGQATAETLARAGDEVVVADRNAEGAETVAAGIRAAGGSAHARSFQAGEDASIHALVDGIEDEIGPIWGLVHAAGLLQNAMTTQVMDMDEHDEIWRVNYRGTYVITKAVGARMIPRQTGAMITIGSINSFAALPLPSYCVGKAAVKSLTELLACEYGVHKIRVNGVAPTYTITPAIQARIDSGHRDPEAIKASGALPILVYPQNIADGIEFLLSDKASAITGVMLPIDAGLIASAIYKQYVAPVQGFGQIGNG
jgi:NAD(P)-dependent dehydrogenase (short-subunit alcohol dehydrogenase family)